MNSPETPSRSSAESTVRKRPLDGGEPRVVLAEELPTPRKSCAPNLRPTQCPGTADHAAAGRARSRSKYRRRRPDTSIRRPPCRLAAKSGRQHFRAEGPARSGRGFTGVGFVPYLRRLSHLSDFVSRWRSSLRRTRWRYGRGVRLSWMASYAIAGAQSNWHRA